MFRFAIGSAMPACLCLAVTPLTSVKIPRLHKEKKFLQFKAHARRHSGYYGKRMQHGNAENFSLWEVIALVN